MKTTVKSQCGKTMVEPLIIGGAVLLSVASENGIAALHLTPDEAEALIFGIQVALEALEVAA